MVTAPTEMSAVPLPVTMPVPVSSTKITDINIDCLEKVFDHLIFEDLLSVADAHTYLRKAADLVYRLKYKNKMMLISCFQQIKTDWKVFCNEHNAMHIYTLKSTLKTFRCFGHNISQFAIFCANINDINYNTYLSYFMSYIGEYCTDRLKYLNLGLVADAALNHITKPLNGVKHLEIRDHGLTTNLLNEKFPNLKQLQIDINGIGPAIDFENIEKYFPYIHQMEIRPTFSRINYRRGSVYAVATLKYTESFTEYKSECPNIRFPFDHLDEICMQIYFRSDDEFYDFFRKYPSITNLTLTQHRYFKHKFEAKDLNMLKLANALPWLKQIDVRCCEFTPNFAIQWIEHFKSLEKFQFYFESHSEYMELQTHLGSEWRSFCSIDGDKRICDLIRNCM